VRMRKNARCSSLMAAAADLAAASDRGSPARRRRRARRGRLFRTRGASCAHQVRDAGNEPAHGERTDQEPVDALLEQETPRDVAPSVGVAHHRRPWRWVLARWSCRSLAPFFVRRTRSSWRMSIDNREGTGVSSAGGRAGRAWRRLGRYRCSYIRPPIELCARRAERPESIRLEPAHSSGALPNPVPTGAGAK